MIFLVKMELSFTLKGVRYSSTVNPRSAISSFPASHESGFNKPLLTVLLLSEMLPGIADETKENPPWDTIPTNTSTMVWLL